MLTFSDFSNAVRSVVIRRLKGDFEIQKRSYDMEMWDRRISLFRDMLYIYHLTNLFGFVSINIKSRAIIIEFRAHHSFFTTEKVKSEFNKAIHEMCMLTYAIGKILGSPSVFIVSRNALRPFKFKYIIGKTSLDIVKYRDFLLRLEKIAMTYYSNQNKTF